MNGTEIGGRFVDLVGGPRDGGREYASDNAVALVIPRRGRLRHVERADGVIEIVFDPEGGYGSDTYRRIGPDAFEYMEDE